MLFWAQVCHSLTLEEGDSWWQIYPFMGIGAIAVIWHFVLLVIVKRRVLYATYMILDLPLFWVVYVFSIIWATRFPL